MSKYVNITVSASLSTDFILEVPDDATEEQIQELAEIEVVLPHKYPEVIDNAIRRMGIVVKGLDSMLRDWNVDDVAYIIDGGTTETNEGEQLNVEGDLPMDNSTE